MIVKNEQDFLDECLNSIQDIADEIIIVDTGSTDKTTEVAEKFKAKIHPFKWVDDFSAARNESIRHATSDWILWLDADERLLPESIPELKQSLKPETKALGYVIQIRNLLPDRKNYRLSGAHRLFNNHKQIKFSGRIHEQIAPSLAELSGEERISKVTLLHHGYALNDQDQQKKNQRNHRLLKQMIKEEPDNGYAHYTLAQNYSIEKEWKKAENHYRKALNKHQFKPDMTCSLYNTYGESLMNLGKMNQAGEMALKSIELIPHQVSAYYLLFKINEQNPESLDWLLKLNKQNDWVNSNGKQLSTDVLLPKDDILWEIIKRYQQSKMPGSVLEYIMQLSLSKQERPEILLIKANALIALRKIEQAQKVLMNPALSENPQALDLLGLIYIQSASFTEAIRIYEKLIEILPTESGIIKRLAGLYAKIGQTDKAAELVNRLTQLK